MTSLFAITCLLITSPSPGVAPPAVQVKPTAKHAASVKSPFPEKYRVMKMPSGKFEYCWLDTQTIIVATITPDNNTQFRTLPAKSSYAKLCQALHQVSLKGPDLPQIVSAGKNLTANYYGRYYVVYRNNGQRGPDIEFYHADICWQQDHTRAVHTFYGTNGRLLDYGDVNLLTYLNNKSPTETPIDNSASNPLFVLRMVIDSAISKQFVCVLSHPFTHKSLSKVDNLTQEVWLLKRNLDNLDGPTQKVVLRVPCGDYGNTKFSPDGKRFFLWSAREGHQIGKMYLGKVSDGSLKRLKFIPRNLSDDTLQTIKWKPDSRSISLAWNGYLYAFPVN
ncbi:MAG: hypothetical protein ABJA67_03255 [Chthonomonadales bacterium]